jgi:hypothetical protein
METSTAPSAPAPTTAPVASANTPTNSVPIASQNDASAQSAPQGNATPQAAPITSAAAPAAIQQQGDAPPAVSPSTGTAPAISPSGAAQAAGSPTPLPAATTNQLNGVSNGNGSTTNDGGTALYAESSTGYGGVSNGYSGVSNGYSGVSNGYGGSSNGYGGGSTSTSGPIITDFVGVQGSGMWTFTGHVVDSVSPEASTVYFGGVLNGRTTLVCGDNNFMLQIDLPDGTQGTATAQMVDWRGLSSNVAMFNVS